MHRISEEDIRNYFSQFGTLTQVTIERNERGLPIGLGSIVFELASQAEKAYKDGFRSRNSLKDYRPVKDKTDCSKSVHWIKKKPVYCKMPDPGVSCFIFFYHFLY